ncbi:MAG: hypothetical protein V1728_04285 [Candidatus Micrarchaeota archaeon]
MADLTTLGLLALAALFLAFLVWLMYQEATKKEWQDVSRGARAGRAKNERE